MRFSVRLLKIIIISGIYLVQLQCIHLMYGNYLSLFCESKLVFPVGFPPIFKLKTNYINLILKGFLPA